MFALTILCFLLLAIAQSVNGAAASIPATAIDRSGYQIVDLQFVGSIGGRDVQLNGTVQEIYDQTKKLYPDFDADAVIAAARNKKLSARGADNKNGLLCVPVPGQDWGRAVNYRIDQGISYLNGLHGVCHINGFGCARISCSWNSAIWACNDNSYDIWPNCGYLASYAQDIENSCSIDDADVWFTGGQEFDSDKYNVIVRDDNC